MLKERNGNINIRINRIIQRPPTAKAGGRRTEKKFSRSILKHYDPDRRNRENCLPSLKFVLFRKNRVGMPFTKVNQVFKEAVEAGWLDGCRRLRFFDRLQTIDADAGSATAAGHRRNAHP